MRIEALTLRNIRSYSECSVAFPAGVTLLAGDIGSGKSTILLAIEFALFGIQRGESSGTMLLRHGATDGEVTLRLRVAGKEVAITRRLKRAASGVGQGAGALTIDGVTSELTAQELKARILELLNYPPGLLSKGKRPLFRSTVFTPQEEMKAILTESAEERMETLRRLFDIDRYRRVRENAILLIRELRRRETELIARAEELGRGLDEEPKLQETLTASERRSRLLAEELIQAEAQVRSEETAVNAMEKERFAREELKKRMAIAQHQRDDARQRLDELAQEAQQVRTQMARTEEGLTPLDIDEEALRAQEAKIARNEALLDEKERSLFRKEAEHDAALRRAGEIVARVSGLEECPTCGQGVDAAHKERIRRDEEAHASKAREGLALLSATKEGIAAKREEMRTRRREVTQKLQLVEANKVKRHGLEAQRQRLATIMETERRLQERRQELEAQTAAHAERLAVAVAVDEESFLRTKRRLEAARSERRKREIEAAELRKDIERLRQELERLGRQGAARKEQERLLGAARRQAAWTSKHLLAVANAVEKALFSNVYGIFNEYFTAWFSTLMEEETISVRLDAGFSPVILQNGYETGFENLSGGEKTSVALAYRLALNKAINEFLSAINTRDLLILDEPTDGFSSEQLDRVREVLDQLRLGQVIIVSHEAQMEGYVDHVLRVEKSGHESRVVAG